jgi:hypothetical protein
MPKVKMVKEFEIDKIARLGKQADGDCAICLDSLAELKVVETSCHHVFHLECIE